LGDYAGDHRHYMGGAMAVGPVSTMKLVLRIVLAVVLGNILGYGLFRLAAWASAFSWNEGVPPTFGALIWRISLTAIAFGAPPVLMGALAGQVAGRYEAAVGVGAALWGVSARQWWPEVVPLLPPESWVAPMTIILLSGLVGGWLVGTRRLTANSQTSLSHTSNDS
jgi:hypothetical protein